MLPTHPTNPGQLKRSVKLRPAAVAPAVPRPNVQATAVLLAGLGLTGLTLQGATPSALAHFAAIGAGVSLIFFC